MKHARKRITRKDKIAADKADAEATFLAYYNDSSWAHDKLRSGTAPLTVEAVRHMKEELLRRKAEQAHKDAIGAEIEAADKADKEQAGAA